jgi:hypothetical protein
MAAQASWVSLIRSLAAFKVLANVYGTAVAGDLPQLLHPLAGIEPA